MEGRMSTPISLFVDDERTSCDSRWTIVKSVYEALRYFQDGSNFDIVEMSLDWYLGSGQPNGTDLVNEMIYRVNRYPLDVFKNTRNIWFHSSDIHMAKEQQALFKTAQDAGIVNKHCKLQFNTNCRRFV